MLPSERGEQRRRLEQQGIALPPKPTPYGYTAAEERVAVILMNTYTEERRRHERQTRPNSSYTINKFAETLETLPAEANRRDTSVENADEPKRRNPSGQVEFAPHTKGWLNVARCVIRWQVDPATFIRRQFSVLTPKDRAPNPGVFTRETALSNYHRGREMDEREIRLSLRSQMDQFKVGVFQLSLKPLEIVGEQAWAMVLDDTNLSLTPLFRYCIAYPLEKNPAVVDVERFRAIMQRFLYDAAFQYVFNAEIYDQVWTTHIPPGFAAKAQQIYDQLHGLKDVKEFHHE